ncbi:polysaccharide deacetylase family protein [Apilactobacillus sp. TMW 2.2459]|uniref:polysaccharide deacetylase family protein n=1 Tax=Apilactobacillus xinyiensis TaxID=2841032 RepID=UPI00200F9B39|nr:polysaccharide deacetylase family protein [Apilactobacillus xinyiensis]MCL0311992.1 polysaccharide deacetylase family protein [Apilactobacillus xinyiensis]
MRMCKKSFKITLLLTISIALLFINAFSIQANENVKKENINTEKQSKNNGSYKVNSSSKDNKSNKSKPKKTKPTSKISKLNYGQIIGNDEHKLTTIKQLLRNRIAEKNKLSNKQAQNIINFNVPDNFKSKGFEISKNYFTVYLKNNEYKLGKVAIPLRQMSGIILNRYLPKTYRFKNVNNNAKTVALTFDDGPDPTLTPKLLKILRRYKVPATFFELGSNVSKYPNISKQVAESGNLIGNHSWSHPQLNSLSKEQINKQIASTNAAIYKATGKMPSYLRPPYGATNSTVSKVAQCPIVMWSVDSMDWKFLNALQTEQQVIKNVYPGSIILMHDIHPTSVQAVPSIINSLRSRGYHFVTIPQIVNRPLLAGYEYFGHNDFRND